MSPHNTGISAGKYEINPALEGRSAMWDFGIGPSDFSQLHGLPYAISEFATVIVLVAVTLKELYMRISAVFELPSNWPIACARAIVALVKGITQK